MEDSFRVRVDKTFGSLSSSSSSSSSSHQTLSSSLWSLTDEELQKNRWTRESDDPISDDDDNEDVDGGQAFINSRKDGDLPPSIDQFFFPKPNVENPNPNPSSGVSLEEVEDVVPVQDEGTSGGGDEKALSSRAWENEVELDVRKSIGMDSTLDLEEEEDQYDKVAVGAEGTSDRLYMRNVTEYTSHDEIRNELPTTFEEASRDPRANLLAAKLRLKEDAEAAKSFDSLHVSDQGLLAVSSAQSNNDGNNLKSILKRKEDQMDSNSILKRKEDQMDSKSDKRVRFDSSCKTIDGGECEADKIVTSEDSDEENTSQYSSLVPDYMRNPSKYTHYTFDSSSDMNEESNRQAYADFLNMLKKSKQSELDEAPADLSKPVLFNPKKNVAGDASTVSLNDTDHSKEITMEEAEHRKSSRISVTAIDLEDEACEMEVDAQVTSTHKVDNGKRTARKYRSKQSLESNESDS